MAEYDDRENDYDDQGGYNDPSEYEDQWQNYDDDNLDNLIEGYDDKLKELDDDLKRRKKPNTREPVQREIDKFKNIKRFLENLRKFRSNWNPKPDQIQATKSCISILEKDIKSTMASLNKCTKEESKEERRKKIKLLEATLSFYKKSLSLIKKKPSSSTPFKSDFIKPKRMSTKPKPQKLPSEKEWSALGEAGGFLKSALGYGWWGTKGMVKGTAGAVKGVASASVAVGNMAIEGGKLAAEGGKLAAEKGSSLYSTFRENQEYQEKVSQQHEIIDQETEKKNKKVVEKVENEELSNEEFLAELSSLDLKTHVINLGIEKNNLEGERRKEEVRREENEKICQNEEIKRVEENKSREEENKRREEEELRREKENKLRIKLINLGKGLSENEQIRLEEEDLRQEQENTRQLNENERQMKEDTRQTFENLRQEDEKIRQTLDNNRKIYWEVMLNEKEEWLKKMGHNNEVFQKLMDVLVEDDKRRNNLEKSLNTNEDIRTGNETIRLENEQDRRSAEEQRIKNEEQRIKNEKARVDAELKRVTGETRREEQEQNRIDEEEKRYLNEEERMANEKARIGREKIAIASEKQRIDNEKRRENFYTQKLEKIPEAEKGREEAEKGRKEREKIYQQNEQQRLQNEKIRISNDERRKFIQEQNLKLLEERANKLDNIEMSFKKKSRIEEKQPKKTFETYFTDTENTTEWIEDENLKKRVEEILRDVDKEENPATYSNALLDGIEQMKNINLTEEWSKKIFKDEREKLKWRQKINALNQALFDKNIVLTDNDINFKEFYDKHLKHSETSKNELNGFYFQDIKVIKRTTQKTFVINSSKVANEKVNEFIEELKKLDSNAETVISNEMGIFADTAINKEMAEDYIRNLQEEQKEIIRRGTLENGEFFEMEDFNEIGREIDDIRKNKKFKIRPKIWAKSFGGYVSRFVKYLKIIFKRIRLKILTGLILTAIGSASTFMILKKFLESAGDKLSEFDKQLPEKLKKLLGKQLEPLKKLLNNLLGDYYGYYFGMIFVWLAYIFRSTIFGFTKSVITLSADIFGLMGKLTYAVFTGLGIIAYYPTTKVLDYLSYEAYKLYEESFYMRNEIPPDSVLERRAEDENMTKENYKKNNVSINRFYNSNTMKLMSYPLTAAGYGGGKAADGGKEVLDWMAGWGIAAGVLGGIIIFITLLIKWRK